MGGYASMTTQQERIAGWRDALVAAGLPFDDGLIFESMPTRDGGKKALEAALPRPGRRRRCSATTTSWRWARRGRWPPAASDRGATSAVVGFDDIDEAEHNAPPLTTVSADTRVMGARCADSLLGLIRGAEPADMSFTGETRLVVRESCGAPFAARRRESA